MLRFLTSYVRVGGFVLQCLSMMLLDLIYFLIVSPVLFLWKSLNFLCAQSMLALWRFRRPVVAESFFPLWQSQGYAITIAQALCSLDAHHQVFEGSPEVGIVVSCAARACDIVHYYCQIAPRGTYLPNLLFFLQHADRLGRIDEYAQAFAKLQRHYRLTNQNCTQLLAHDSAKLPLLLKEICEQGSKVMGSVPKSYTLDIITRRLNNENYQAISFESLINRLLTEEVSFRGGHLAINLRMQQVLAFFYAHPEHLDWADQIAAEFLRGCVNQPLTGWLEICAWIEIAQQKDIRSMINAAGALYALAQVKELVLSTQEITDAYKPEAVCILAREVCRKLQHQGHLTRDWVGLFDIVAHEFNDFSVGKYPLHGILSREGCENWRLNLLMNNYYASLIIFYQSLNSWLGNAKTQYCIARITHKVAQMTDEERLETLFSQSAGKHIWGRIAYRERLEQYQNTRRKEIFFSQKAVLYFLGDDSMEEIESELRGIGYSFQEFEDYLEQYCPKGNQVTDQQKHQAYEQANNRRIELDCDIDISLHDKVISWTRTLIPETNQRQRAC